MEIVSRSEVAKRLGVGPDTIRRWVRDRGLPALRVTSGTVRFDWVAVKAWLRRSSEADRHRQAEELLAEAGFVPDGKGCWRLPERKRTAGSEARP